MKINLQDIFNIPTAVIYYPDKYVPVSSVSIDTRTIKKNSIFVAIKGQKFDGHNYVHQAIKKGAKAIVVSSRKLNYFEDVKVPIISVRNTTAAYAELAKIWRKKLSAKVISITGSNGKTTTKEIIAHLLSQKFKVHKTYSNNNNQIGVPLTILSAPADTDFIVLEHGTNHFGEIEFTSKCALPDFALITNIGNSHIKYLESKEKILLEKSELFNHLNNNGIAFVNNDDHLIRKIKKNYKNVITYGFNGKPEVKGKIIGGEKTAAEKISIDGFGKKIESEIPLIGKANMQNYLAAVTIALKVKLSKSDILKAAKTLKPNKGRMENKVFKNFNLIDDSYNSNPESVKSAIEVLRKYKSRSKRIILLGDMFELGKDSEYLHKKLVTDLEKIKNLSLYTIGKETKKISENLKKVKEKKHFSTRRKFSKFLSEIDLNDAVILVKGSRGMKMEDFAEVIMKRAN